MVILTQTLVNIQRHIYDVEAEAFRREAGDRARSHVEPRLISGLSHAVVEIEQKLIRTTTDGRHLSKCKSQADGLRELNALHFNGFVPEKRDETAPPRMGPNIASQQVSQLQSSTERNLALPDPLNHGVAPMPVA